MYIFGGYDGENRLNDFHQFVLEDDDLSGQSSVASLKQDLLQYVANDEFSDVEIKIQNDPLKVIPAHRLMLSRCERFEDMIDTAQVVDGKSQIHVDDMDYDTAV